MARSDKQRRRDMTDAEKEDERRRAKYRAMLKARGKGGAVDAAPMQARIRELHDDYGVPLYVIAERSGVNLRAICSHYHGRYSTQDEPVTWCQWRTYNAIMTAEFGPADYVWPLAVVTRRRIGALVAAGYPQSWLAERCGMKLAAMNHFQLAKYKRVSAEFASAVEQVYRKYVHEDPLDHGVAQRAKTYAIKVAGKRRWAPEHCWDEDTIRDPLAVPEWTGQCGTVYGFRIHYRDKILPVCEHCSKARLLARKWPALAALMGVAAAPGTPGTKMSDETLHSIQSALEEGVGLHAIAADFGCSTRTVERIKREMADVG